MDETLEWLRIAMEKRQLVQYRIDQRFVVFEPHLYGRGHGNKDVVLGFELHGAESQTTPGWQLYPANGVEPTVQRGLRAIARELPIDFGPAILEVYFQAK